MIFGSVCSGIEAATVAWEPLGWKAAWYAEIEKFPSRVLAARHGQTPNLGDMTKLHDLEVFRGSTLDVLVGGTPCQSFSIAGLRKGLADPRGNLALVFLGLIDRARPRWVVWENVPGVLSSWSDVPESRQETDDAGGDRDLFGGSDGPGPGGVGGPGYEPCTVDQTNDFDSFTRGLSELGYGVAWAVLDAQHFGVPQRRQRVFVVAHLGAAAPAAAVLLDRHCLCGHPAPSRQAREGAASGFEVGPGSGRFTDLSPTLDARCKDGPIRNQLGVGIAHGFSESGQGFWREGDSDIGPLRAQGEHSSKVSGLIVPPAGGVPSEDVAHTLKGKSNDSHDATHDTYVAQEAVVFKPCHFTRGKDGAPSEVSPPVTAEQDRGDTHPVVFSIMPQNLGKDYKARPVDVAQPLMAAGPGTGAQGGDVVLVPKDDVAGTLGANHGNIKAEDAWGGKLIAFSGIDSGHDSGKDLAPTLRKGGEGAQGQALSVVIPCIPILEAGARTGKSTDDPRAGMGVGADGDPMLTLQSGKQHAVTVPAEIPFTYVAVLEERGSGKRHEFRDKWENGWQNLIFFWTEGNFSCDCNRIRLIAENDFDEETDPACSVWGEDQVILRELRVEGAGARVVYPESLTFFCRKCEERFEDRHATGTGTLAPAECPMCGEEDEIDEVRDAAKAYDMRGNGDDETTPMLTGHHAGAVSDFSPMIFDPLNNKAEKVSTALGTNCGQSTGRSIAFTPGAPEDGQIPVGIDGGETAFALRSGASKSGDKGDGGMNTTTAISGAAVRRLTPRECERLQGFPDDYTLIPDGNRTDDEDYAETVDYLIASGWPAKEAMELADTPDGPRYKALGNSMAVPVMRWIGERIAAVDEFLYPKK